MRLRTLYLQRMLSVNGRSSLAGRQLYDQFRSISDNSLLGYLVLTNEAAAKYSDPRIKNDILSHDLIKQLDPNLIYIEGGLFANNEGGWRIPRTIIEEVVSDGAVLILADVDTNQLREHKAHYQEAGTLFQAFADYGEHDLRDAVYGADQSHFWGGHRQIVCDPQKMVVHDWLRPIYNDVTEIMVGIPARLSAWENIVASGNQGSTGTLQEDLWVDAFDCCPFASAAKVGFGYMVFIAGQVSADVWLERCPDNVKWLANLGEFLVEDASRDRTRALSYLRSPFLLFLSHRSVNKSIVEQVASEIKRGGIAVWLDKERLVPSDSLVGEISRGLHEMTHFVLFWSEACVGASWVERELHAAVSKLVENKLPILVVRLDNTPAPAIITDLYRIEGSELSPTEIGAAIVDAVERLAKRKKP